MKLRRNIKSEENRAAAASLLAELEDEESTLRSTTTPSAKEPGSNQVQTEAKVGSKAESNKVQSGFKLGSTRETEKRKVGSEVGSEVGLNPVQTGFKLGSNFQFHRLSPLQQKILIFFAQQCQLERSKITPPVKCALLAKSLEASVDGLKTATKRLLKSRTITIHEYMDGRAGWTRYELPEHVFKTLVLNKTGFDLGSNQVQTGFQVGSKVGSEVGSSLSSSSRNLLIKEPTPTQPVDALSQIDLSLVQPFGITASVLARCIELYPVLKPEQLEVLVFRFAEFAKDPKNRVQNARGFFISLAEQASKGQVPLDHIETPDERLMRSFIERQKKAQARRTDIERAAQEFECEAWLESLTPEMKLILVPETAILKAGTGAHAAILKSHFAEKVWPERRKEILEKEVSL